MTRKKERPIKTTSRKTGAIILLSTVIFISLTLVFLFLAMTEADKILENEKRFRALSCEDMKKEYDSDKTKEPWKFQAINDKVDCQ